MPDAVTYTARWIVPVSSEPLEGGTITVEGTTIAAVEPKGVRTPDVDLGNVAIIPGLVNCHTHLDLSGARGKIPPTNPEHFTDWLKGVIAYRRSRTPEQTQADIREGLAECLRYGTTLVGDITAGGASWDALVVAQLRAVAFLELIGLKLERAEVSRHKAEAWMNEGESNFCRRALSPHAPYSVHKDLFVEAGRLCRLFENGKRPLAIHLGECREEIDLLHRKHGPFRAFLESMNVWDREGLSDDFASIMKCCDFGQPKLFIHMNHVAPSARIPRNSTCIYCPRTHAAFGHPRHPFREFQARGVRVALGTDSLASNPDLDLLAEARFIHSIRPEVPCEELLRMATLTGAEALGWADETGSLEVGKSADFVVLPLPDRENDVYRLILDDGSNHNRRTMFRGEWRTAPVAPG
jgi:cytosine/adenosine deaminase-related metal-dependent hydrolase